jgi:hypothetical protein
MIYCSPLQTSFTTPVLCLLSGSWRKCQWASKNQKVKFFFRRKGTFYVLFSSFFTLEKQVSNVIWLLWSEYSCYRAFFFLCCHVSPISQSLRKMKKGISVPFVWILEKELGSGVEQIASLACPPCWGRSGSEREVLEGDPTDLRNSSAAIVCSLL